jgi:hypothetical protein
VQSFNKNKRLALFGFAAGSKWRAGFVTVSICASTVKRRIVQWNILSFGLEFLACGGSVESFDRDGIQPVYRS